MIVVNKDKFDKQRFYLLTHKIKQIKSQYDSAIESDDMSMKGSRYNDDDRIARTVVGIIHAECDLNLDRSKLRFLAMDSVEIEPYIKQAVLESASADYYYTYEKEY